MKMKPFFNQRSWVSPFVAVTYAVVSVTGILLVFHMRFPGICSIHQGAGLLFVLAGMVHLTLNWRMFVSHFKNRNAVAAVWIGLFLIICLALALPGTGQGQRQYSHKARLNFNPDR